MHPILSFEEKILYPSCQLQTKLELDIYETLIWIDYRQTSSGVFVTVREPNTAADSHFSASDRNI